jgi:soluble lytic murein transglycosylase-like protein
MVLRPLASILTIVAILATAATGSAAPTTPRSAAVVLGERLGRAISGLDKDPKDTAKQLRQIENESDLLDDFSLYFLGLAEAPTDADAAISTLDSLLSRFPDSVVTPKAAALLSELLLANGNSERLAELADAYASADRRSEHAARLSFAAARGLAEKEPKRADDYLQRARRQSAGTKLARTIRKTLNDLREKHSELKPTSATALYAEAVLVGGDGTAEEQAALLDQFLDKYPTHAKATDAVLMRAKILSRSNGRLAAAKWLGARAHKAKTSRTKARLLYAAASHAWNGNDSAAARHDFEAMLALNTGISSEQKAHYALGRLHEASRRYNAAAASYRKAARGSDERVALEAKWRAGWASYLAGNYDGAAFVFGRMADEGKDAPRGVPSGREEGLYWQARSLGKAEKRDKAASTYRVLLDEYPDGFYAYLAEKRTGLTADPPNVVKVEPGNEKLPTLAARVLNRARALHAAELEQFASEEIAAGLKGVDAGILRRVLPEVLELGAFNTALRTSLVLYRRGLLEEDQLYPYLYPAAFEETVKKEASARGLDPYLIFSLMRQESLFDRFAASSAAAYGLMQLLVPTANRMAAKTGLDEVDANDLYDPKTNIKLGVQYLADLAERFDGDPILMLAGYNAGEKAADRWLERLNGLEQDEFIEQISYRETRNYVKKILRNHRNYLRLYGELRRGATAQLSD